MVHLFRAEKWVVHQAIPGSQRETGSRDMRSSLRRPSIEFRTEEK